MKPTFSIGDRVILINNGKYKVCPENPLWDSVYGCVGTVKISGGITTVIWDNRKQNIYSPEDLSLKGSDLSEDNPNSTYKTKRAKTQEADEGMVVRDYSQYFFVSK